MSPGFWKSCWPPGLTGKMKWNAFSCPKTCRKMGQAPDPELALAWGFEVSRTRQAQVAGRSVEWQERLLVVRSFQYTQSTQKLLHRRLDKAEKALKALTPPRGRGKRQIKDEASLLAAIQRIEEKYRVQGLFEYDYQQEVTERQIRAYGDKPARTERKVRFQLTVTRNEQAIAAAEFRAGWRIYATNAPAGQLDFDSGCVGLPGSVHRREHLPPLAGQDSLHYPGLRTARRSCQRLVPSADPGCPAF